MNAIRNVFMSMAVITVTAIFLLCSCSEKHKKPLPCMERAVFGEPSQSPYILPYSAGASFRLMQGYCYTRGGHRNQLAYDFETPVGSEVIAARSGLAMKVRSDLPDDGKQPESGQHNHIMIKHEDGTVAFYAHLMQYSVIVQPGDTVEIGEYFARSGNSGDSGEPHLHFGVYETYPPVEGVDVPVTFRNADGPLDDLGGLIRGEIYTALPY